MNTKRLIHFVLPTILSLCIVSPLAFADNHTPQVLSETWVLTPKNDKFEDMRGGMKKHLEYIKKLKEPRVWRFYSPVLGNQLESIAVRSFGFSWADMDVYRDRSTKNDSQKSFNEKVDIHVSNYEHYMSVIDTSNSNWGPDVKYRYVGVTSYMVKLGHRAAVEADKKLLSDAAKAKNWPFNWEWADSVSGQDMMQLAVPYQNWANMAPPEITFAEILTKHLGDEAEAKKVLERWSSHFSSISYNIWALHEDMK